MNIGYIRWYTQNESWIKRAQKKCIASFNVNCRRRKYWCHIDKWYVENESGTVFDKMIQDSIKGDKIFVYRPQTLSKNQFCALLSNKIDKNVDFSEYDTSSSVYTISTDNITDSRYSNFNKLQLLLCALEVDAREQAQKYISKD